jgi:hypothetical protein
MTDMLISNAFPSEFLRAVDLRGKQVRATIDRVEMREVGDDHKPCAFFIGKERGLILNKTNSTTIADAYGDDTDEWPGQEIVLFEATVQFQGKVVKAIRVRIPTPKEHGAVKKQAVPAPAAPAESENPGADMQDEIPF